MYEDETLEGLEDQAGAESGEAVTPEDEAGKGGQEQSSEGTNGQGSGEEGADAGRPRQSQEKPRQGRDENARIAAARRAGEEAGYRRGYQARQKEDDERIARQGVPHPDREGATIRSVDDFVEYGQSYRAKTAGKSRAQIEEDDRLREWHEQQQAQEQAREREQQLRERARQDREDFMESYPNVDLQKLMKSQRFGRFVGDRIGRVPLVELYEDYKEVVSESEMAALAKADRKAEKSTGAGGAAQAEERLTNAQKQMLAEWNRDNPHMKMSAKEFLAREK